MPRITPPRTTAAGVSTRLTDYVELSAQDDPVANPLTFDLTAGEAFILGRELLVAAFATTSPEPGAEIEVDVSVQIKL